MLNTILFDLDGTLLPFIEKEFIHSYFERLTNCVVPLGYEKENFIKVLWAGTMDMIAIRVRNPIAMPFGRSFAPC